MRFGHVNLVARDLDRIAGFYCKVLGCAEIGGRRLLSGEKVARGNGLAGGRIEAVWLSLPGMGAGGPFLEIFQFGQGAEAPVPPVDAPGLGHLSFEVEDIRATMAQIIAGGGTAQGEVTDLGEAGAPVLCVYMRVPEGNLVELEQK